ncbi:MAG TPA: acylphosphatase [Gemmata sp.]|jgi:acylphosphatase|nr:acylphosphatase [Gemmata sp.]
MAKRVYYAGYVQGVGFRATAARIARLHPIRGWVRNLADGRVELLVDGLAEAIEAFLADIRLRMAEYIETEEVTDRESDMTLDGFRIVY